MHELASGTQQWQATNGRDRRGALGAGRPRDAGRMSDPTVNWPRHIPNVTFPPSCHAPRAFRRNGGMTRFASFKIVSRLPLWI